MRSWNRWCLVALVVAFGAASGWEARHDSTTVDEAFDISSGLATVVHRDTRFTPEHGLLPRVIAVLPALAIGPEVPKGEAFRSGDWFDLTDEVITANDDGSLEDITFLARLVPIAVAVAAGLGVHRLASMLHGPGAGLLAAAGWFLTPYVIGLGHLATTDVPFAASVVWTSVALLAHLRAPTDRTAALLGLALGVALLTRHLAVVVVATTLLSLLVAGWRGDRRRLVREVGVVLLVPLALVWLVYRAIDPGGGGDARLASFIDAGGHDALTRLVLLAPFPQEWRAGFAYLSLTSEARPAYLLGQAWTGSRWWFFPASAVVKLPASGLVLVLAGLVVAVRRRLGGTEVVHVAVLPAVALSLALLAQPLNLGFRYAVPVLALVLVAASPIVEIGRAAAGRVVLVGALGLQLVACAVALPHSLAWTSPPFTEGYRWASDSNLDYGQDLFRLREWEHIEGARVAVVTPRGLGRPDGSLPLVGADPSSVEGWVAVGATALTVVDRDELSWLRAYCPVGSIGGSILLYLFAEPPTDVAGPVIPAAPCSGPTSTRSG